MVFNIWFPKFSFWKVSSSKPEENKIRQEDLTKIISSAQKVQIKQETIESRLSELKRLSIIFKYNPMRSVCVCVCFRGWGCCFKYLNQVGEAKIKGYFSVSICSLYFWFMAIGFNLLYFLEGDWKNI